MSLDECIHEFYKKIEEGRYDDAFDIYWSGLGNHLRENGHFKENLDIIRRLFPNGEYIDPVLKRDIGWAHLMLGVAYYENGFPGIALNHITANINTDGENKRRVLYTYWKSHRSRQNFEKCC